ncbi:MAG: DUF3833 domain-containing protein [Rhizobiales bacterium]|nr:DUF3833 domain-containing protein [Hyphomicrobiales bacterium]
MKRLFLVIATLLTLSACAKPSIDGDLYLGNTPEFRLEQFFQGEIKAWGIVQDRSGNLLQQFEADIIGTFEDGVLTLDETFTYSLGEGVEERVWTITKDGENSYSGSASDIPGASGTAYGNAMFWGYEMDLPVGDDTYRVTFEDWIWAVDDRRIFNRSYIKKFGVVFAEVTIFMEKRAPS